VTQAGEHNPYNPSPVYCISPQPQPSTLSLSLSLSLSLWNPKREKKNVDSFRPRSATSPPLRFWRCGRFASGAKEGSSIFVGASQNQSSSPKEVQYPRHRFPAAEKLVGSDPNHPPQRAHPSNTTDLAEDVTRTWRLQTRDVRDAIIFRGAGLGVRGVLRVVVQARCTSMRPPLLLLVRSQEYVLH